LKICSNSFSMWCLFITGLMRIRGTSCYRTDVNTWYLLFLVWCE